MLQDNIENNEINWGKKNELLFIALAIMIAGFIAKIPQFQGVREDLFYEKNVSFIFLPFLIIYFNWKNQLAWSKLIFPFVIMGVSVIYINTLPYSENSDSNSLSYFHLPILTWILLGFTYVGTSIINLKNGISFYENWVKTGILAEIKGKSNQIVALRADMDALPIQEENICTYTSVNKGIMHACGHDVHSASVLGAAIILQELKDAQIDTVVLGCTHFPLISGAIGYTLGPDVAIVSSADETARDLYRVLVNKELLRDEKAGKPTHEFLATGDVSTFAPLAKRFLGPEVANVQQA
jgi:hypothetical protein